MTVNRGPVACEASFEIADLPARAVRVLGEDRDVAAQAGLLTDRFDPYSTHVYEISR